MKSPCNLFVITLTLVLSFFAVSALGARYAPQTNGPTAAGPNVISTTMTGFGVPFSINDPDNRFIEVHLYVSKDRGQTWQYHDRTGPRETQFPYQSKGDGEYWFALKTLDRDRKLNPDGDPRAELKVIVDTRKPTLDLEVSTDRAGRLICKWRAEDRFIDPATLKISYKAVAAATDQWKPIEYRPIHTQPTGNVFVDQLAWWPEVADQQVQVRLEVQDRAGNITSDSRNVFVRKVAAATSNVAIANRAPASDQAGNQLAHSAPPAHSAASPNGLQCSGGVCRMPPKTHTGNTPLINAPPKVRIGSAPEYADPPRPPGSPRRDIMTSGVNKKVSLNPSTTNVLKYPAPNNSKPSTTDPEAIAWHTPEVSSRSDQKQVVSSTAGQGGNLFDRDDFESEQVIATGSTKTNRNPYAIGQGVNQQVSNDRDRQPLTPPKGASPSSQTTDSFLSPTRPMRNVSQPLRERAETSPTNVRPLPTASEFGRVLPKRRTSSEGHERSSSGAGGNKIKSLNSRRFLLNYNVDAIDPSGVGKVVLWVTRNGGQTWSSMATDNNNESPFPVQVDEDGEFGFRVVIHSKDGLVGRPPSRGDEPDMQIRIDTEAPTGKIVSVPYGSGNDVGRLVINWRANDSELRTKPIDLAYSTNGEGPWTDIEQGIRNTGSYSWKVGRDIPDQIFLRMAIHDAAGNTTVQKLTQAIDVSGLVPRGRINGVQAVTTQ